MPAKTKKTRSCDQSRILKDTTNLKTAPKCGTPEQKSTKKRQLEAFLKDYDTQVEVREKKMQHMIADFCKSIHSLYNVLIQKIPKEYQDMKLEDYIARSGGNIDKPAEDDIDKMLLDIIPAKSALKHSTKKKKKMQVAWSKTPSPNENDLNYVPVLPKTWSAKKRKPSPKRAYPHVEELQFKRFRTGEDGSAVSSAPKPVLRSAVGKKENKAKLTDSSIQNRSVQSGEHKTLPRRTPKSTYNPTPCPSTTRNTRSRAAANTLSTSSLSTSKLSAASTQSNRNRTTDRVTAASTSKKNSRVAPGGKASGLSKTGTRNDQLTLICSLPNGATLTINPDTDLKNLPLSGDVLENLRAFKRKLSFFLRYKPRKP